MAKRRKVGNLLALALLALLAPGNPMHPYQMANLLRRTGKEQDIDIKWGSLYTVVANLEKHGFIEATGSDREGRRPERTSYAITADGRAELTDWLRELVAVPEPEQRKLSAALSVLGVLSPDEVTTLLAERLRALDGDIAARRAVLEQSGPVPRVFLIEAEYALAMREAETAWVRSLLTEITEGTLSGVAEWRDYHETGEQPAEWARLLAEEETPRD
ncbi:PadR family transcriptional regulator [Rugosimonospora africana]|uniref:PadR family transcriptional regulator n=1 Tax=Rugosimonospora africana TaxID=556532 RepID=A0A8J3VP86_9ACTN|nr:PadR family transcriptional regulator [Rugosimonospora africana]GIH13840.1 PadR family transcriptional regulator [Rugosimonospora africana]